MSKVAEARGEAGDLRGRLSVGLVQLGLDLDEAQQVAMIEYLGLLEKWNAVYNLTAIRDRHEMLAAHVMDSLALIPLIKTLGIRHLLDVGSGAGLPGIPLAIALPKLQVDLVDAVQKKVAFQNQVKAQLGLVNLWPHHARVEALTLGKSPDGIVSRAFSTLAEMASLARPLLAEGGYLIAMKGQNPAREIAELKEDWKVSDLVTLAVPGLEAQRCAVVLERR